MDMNDLNRRRFLFSFFCLGFSAASALTAAKADTIHDAVAKGNLAEVKRLLAKHPGWREARNRDHLTPLIIAVALGRSDIAHFLVRTGANVNAHKADGNSPLFDAAYHGDTEMLSFLLQHKADINARNKKGETALHYAVIYDKPDVARVLLEHQARVDGRQGEGKTPLLCAVETNRSRFVQILLAHGADMGAPDDLGNSPLLLTLSRFTGGLDETGTALLASLPVSLHLTNVPLHDALVQLFAQTKQKVTVSDRLISPVSLSVTTNFGDALGKLLHPAREGDDAPATVATGAGVVQIRASDEQAEADHALWPVFTRDPKFQFYQRISLPVLNSYLSRAVTHFGLCAISPEPSTSCFGDDLRMLTDLGAKFIGRAAYAWVPPDDEEAHFRQANARAAKVARADPEIILQACIFEAVQAAVGNLPVPEWVFQEFGLPVERRTFNYSAMLYDGNKYHNHWAKDASVPDMSKAETKMYFYYRARRYIDSGFESLHFGQVGLMDENDPQHAHWWEMLTRVRRYAAQHARRRMVLCDAHTHGVVVGGGLLLFDLHAWPLMAQDVKAAPQQVELIIGYYNSIYHQSAGGVTVSGWACDHLPYICEFDCGGVSDKPGQPSNFPWNWGYSCGDWFAHQPAEYRRGFLRYANDWLTALQEDAHLQMPTRLNLAVPIEGVKMWQANQRSPACPMGFSLENDIRAIWH